MASSPRVDSFEQLEAYTDMYGLEIALELMARREDSERYLAELACQAAGLPAELGTIQGATNE